MISVSKYRAYPSTKSTNTGSSTISKFKQETITVNTNGQTVFLLAQAPIDGKIILNLNGVTVSTSSYTVINKTITYIDTNIAIEIGDSLEVTYLRQD